MECLLLWCRTEGDLESFIFCLLLPHPDFSEQWPYPLHHAMEVAQLAPLGAVPLSHLHHSLVGTRVQVMGGKKREGGPSHLFLGSFPHTAEGVVAL